MPRDQNVAVGDTFVQLTEAPVATLDLFQCVNGNGLLVFSDTMPDANAAGLMWYAPGAAQDWTLPGGPTNVWARSRTGRDSIFYVKHA